MFERIRALTDSLGSSDQRYADPEGDYTPPQEYEDPHTRENSSKQTWLDKLLENRWWALSVSLLALFVLILAIVYAGRFLITVIANPWVQRIAAGSVIAAGGLYVGQSREREKLKHRDELTLYDPDARECYHFLGRFERVQGAAHDVFVPHAGHDGDVYKVGALSQELVRRHNHDPEDPARIRLHPGVMTVVGTDRGRKVVQLSAGIDPDPFGRESNLEATLPDMAATDTVSDLKSELEKADEEIDDLEAQLTQVRRQRDNARKEARKNYEEVRKEIEKDAEIFRDFVRRQRSSSEDSRDESVREKRRALRANGEDN